MRPRSSPCCVLRACPNATAGPSRLPAAPFTIHRGLHLIRTQSAWTYHPIRAAKRYASSTPSSSTSITASGYSHPAFDELSTSLSSWLPCFGARGDEVRLLTSPGEFYKDVLDMLKRAKRRILISTLYIGVEETELVDTIRTALASNPHLRTTFILDYHRSTRLSSKTATDSGKAASTAHLLLPLIEEFGDRVEVWFFRSPNLKGVLEKVVPERYDEGWGTWHGKWYAVDED